MQINRSTAAARPAAYKVQNLADPAPAQSATAPAAQPTAVSPEAKAQAAAVGGTMFWGGAVAAAVGALLCPPVALAGLAIGAVGGFGWLVNQNGKQPELAKPADTPAPKPVAAEAAKQPLDGPGRRRLERIFDELDEDKNGRLEGDELNDNTLLGFVPETDEGMTRADFVAEASQMDGIGDLRLADVKAASLKTAIFTLMTEVWGTDAYCNDTSFAWWKGQLKTVNGDMDRLRGVMEDYKKGIDR